MSRGSIAKKSDGYQNTWVFFIILSSFLALSSILTYYENWSFLDSAYFMILTGFTIGATGDLYPQETLPVMVVMIMAHFSLVYFGIIIILIEFCVSNLYESNRDILAQTNRVLKSAFMKQVKDMVENLNEEFDDETVSKMEKIVEDFSVNFMDAEDHEIGKLEKLSHVLADPFHHYHKGEHHIKHEDHVKLADNFLHIQHVKLETENSSD
jgi:hypothetical protein